MDDLALIQPGIDDSGRVVGKTESYRLNCCNITIRLEGRRAMIRYRPAADANYAGEIAELGIRDDLPGPPEGVPPNSATAASH